MLKKIGKFIRNMSTLSRGLCLLVIGLAFLVADIFCGLYWKDTDSEAPRLFVTSVISTLSSIFIVSAVWEWFCKIAFAKQIQLNVQMAEDVIDSGIIGTYDSFENIKWRDELRNVSEFTAFLKFGRTWLKEHAGAFRDYIYGFKENAKCTKAVNHMTVILPNFKNKKVLKTLLFLYPQKSIKTKNGIKYMKKFIKESIDICKDIDKNIKIKLFDGVPETSYYRMDKSILMIPYPHDRKEKRLPVIKVANGRLYDFCNDDLNAIIKKCKDYNN